MSCSLLNEPRHHYTVCLPLLPVTFHVSLLRSLKIKFKIKIFTHGRKITPQELTQLGHRCIQTNWEEERKEWKKVSSRKRINLRVDLPGKKRVTKTPKEPKYALEKKIPQSYGEDSAQRKNQPRGTHGVCARKKRAQNRMTKTLHSRKINREEHTGYALEKTDPTIV